MQLRCRLHVAGRGNLFMRELADVYAAALADLGVATSVHLDALPVGGDGVVDLIVAPHEYFALNPLSAQDAREVAAHSVLLTTEQPTSQWFHSGIDAVLAGRAVLDLHDTGVAALAAHGKTAVRAPLGYHGSIDAWGGTDGERPVDYVFLGGGTPRRLGVLGHLSSRARGRSCRLLVHDPAEPVTEAGPGYVTGRTKAELLAGAHLVVNVHRSEEPYFEWARALDAICNGAVLVTETTAASAPLEPYVHFVEAETDLLADHVVALLHDHETRRRIARAAYDFVRSGLDLATQLADLVPMLEASACTGAPRTPPELVQLPEAAPRPAWTPIDPVGKRTILGQLSLGRRMERLESLIRFGSPEVVDDRVTEGWSLATPEVTVVVPHYQLEEHAVEALDSVLASEGIEIEIVVVDDHSAPHSIEALHRYLDEHNDAPIRLLTRSSNRGLAAGRNLAISLARAEHCFLLDPDNLVGHTALRRLHEVLAGSDAFGAYSTIEVFGDESALLSERPWSVTSLCRGPYIDAMSMISRAGWQKVGGFEEHGDVLHGWEDYDLWLRVAAAGLHLLHIPEPLSLYRRRAGSMISITNLDVAGPNHLLRQRYPDLPWT